MAPMRLMRRPSPAMAERGWGRVVNVSSTAGKRPSATMGEYSVAKAAELSLSRLLRRPSRGLRRARQRDLPRARQVGDVDAGRRAARPVGRRGGGDRDDAIEAAGAKRPIGRLAEVDEIASAIVFLCSERASYVAGAAWSVDGGPSR